MTTRYLTYGVQFLLSLVIAEKLGPFFLGIYGVITLILNYFQQFNFGISHSLNVLLVHNKRDKKKFDAYFFNSVSLYIWMAIIILIAYIASIILGWNFGLDDYNISNYLPIIITIAILTYFSSLLTCVARVKNDLITLTFVGSIPVLLNAMIIWFFSGKLLILALILSNLISLLITFAWCFYRGIIPHWEKKYSSCNYKKEIFRKGIYLFMYNSCFYFIIISLRTIISSNYPIEEFGYFTFSYSIVNAVMLLIDSFNTIIFPKTIDLMSTDNIQELKVYLYKMRVAYTTTSHCLIYIALIAYPIFVVILPKYNAALQSMYLISLTVLMNTTSFGYTSLIIAKNKERIAAKISFIALCFNILLSIIMVFVFEVTFSYVVLATLITYMFFAFMCTYEGERLIYGNYNFKNAIMLFFPMRLLIPYCIAIIVSLVANPCFTWIPLIVFLLFNIKDIRFLLSIAKKLTKTPDIINV